MNNSVASKRWDEAALRSASVRGRRGEPAYFAVVAALIGSVLTAGAWYVASRAENDLVQRETANRATSIQIAVEGRLDAYVSVLQAAAGLFDASDDVTASDWTAFTERLRASPIYPGVQGVGFAVRVREPRDVERYHKDSSLRLWPEREADERSAIVYLQPLTDRNRAALGFDMMSEITRRMAMERARDSASPALSGKVSLVQEITEDKQSGFLLYVPVYEHGRSIATTEERRAALHGFVYSPFRFEDFLLGVLGRIPADVSLAIYDGATPTPNALLYGTEIAPGSAQETRALALAGHEWTLIVQPLAMLSAKNHQDSRWILLGGSVATLLSAAAVFALALGRQHARERLQIEHALLEGERYASAVIKNSLDAYISIDREDRIIDWNRKAEEVFGWSASEVRGTAFADTIVPEALRERHRTAMRRADPAGGKLLGRRIEMPARTRDGRDILVELSILAVQRAEQTIFVASLRDISKHRAQETELLKLNERLEHIVVERTHALEQANEVLRSTNLQLDAFTRNVSHDLRAPLRAIEGYARLAAEEGESSLTGASRSHLRAVLRNVHRMQSMVDGLLELAWIGQQPLRAQRVDLWEMILDIVNEFLAEQTFVLRGQPESLQSVWADPTLLVHAMRNLLSNAVKFSGKRSEATIEVGMEDVDGERRYFVRDNGIGFDARNAGALFEVFGRLHRADEYEGTGVGLTIVKSVIERHGGRVWADSVPGEGATFWFTLPKQPR